MPKFSSSPENGKRASGLTRFLAGTIGYNNSFSILSPVFSPHTFPPDGSASPSTLFLEMRSTKRKFFLGAVFATALATTTRPAAAIEKDFILNGLTVRLEEITPEVDVFFQSMRFV